MIGKLLDGTECQILYWIQEKANHSCPCHITYGANLYIHYQSLLLQLKEFKGEVNNSLVYCFYHTNSDRYTWS